LPRACLCNKITMFSDKYHFFLRYLMDFWPLFCIIFLIPPGPLSRVNLPCWGISGNTVE
jgi:hypothetical protein